MSKLVKSAQQLTLGFADEYNEYANYPETKQSTLFVKFAHKLSFTQVNLFILFLNQLRTQFKLDVLPLGATYYEIPMSEIKKYQSINYSRIAEESSGLAEITIEGGEYTHKGGNIPIFGHGVWWDSDKGVVILGLTPQMLQAFMDLSNIFFKSTADTRKVSITYGEYYREESLTLGTDENGKVKGKYWEGCKLLFIYLSYYYKRNANKWTVSIAELKRLLGRPDAYKRKPQLFIDNVVKLYVREINRKTSMKVMYRILKTRGDWSIVFTSVPKGKALVRTQKLTPEQDEYFKELRKYGVYPKNAREVVINHMDTLLEVLSERRCDFYKEYQGGIPNPGSFILDKCGLTQRTRKKNG